MWRYNNPVDIYFGSGCIDHLPALLNDRRYALITYNEPYFSELIGQLSAIAGEPVIVINDIHTNPDIDQLEGLCQQLNDCSKTPEVIVALGGGSVIDTAKFLSAAGTNFIVAKDCITSGAGYEHLSYTPIIAIPTTAGTGSEVTCWATVWDKKNQRKYSLTDPQLYPESALCDPELTINLPLALTLSTGLDALSHALESIWNKNRNRMSSLFAFESAKQVIATLPELIEQLTNLPLREQMMESALTAGMAFSNTKTSIAHNISYDVTLQFGTPHGIACSFTLPQVMRSVIGENSSVDEDLKAIFGEDLDSACTDFEQWFHQLGIKTTPADYGYDAPCWQQLLRNALNGQRGKNFIGQQQKLLACYPIPET